MVETFQLSGDFVSPTITTTPSLLATPAGSNAILVCNPSTTLTIFIHPQLSGTAAPVAATVLRGIQVYPGTSVSVSIAELAGPRGADYYLATASGSVQINAYGVI